VTLTHQEIFQRYLHAGTITRNPEAFADLFTEDGVYECPLVPDGHRLPRRLSGRAAIRDGIGAHHREPGPAGTLNLPQSRYVLHDTADPETFIVEIDTVFDAPDGSRTAYSLVQIFRIREDRIALLRDYFAASPLPATAH
jgi:ketosteroid isomerase-like protein